MTQPPTDETERAEAAQAALAESLERAHELVSEARFVLRPHDTSDAPEPPAET
jgi:hypothetical protein